VTRQSRRTALSLALAALALTAACAALAFLGAVRDTRFPATQAVVLIPSGASGRAVAHLLAENKIVASAFAFDLLAGLKGERSAMKAGEFRFEAHRPMTAILAQVVAGTGQTAVWVTIPEGFTAREIAESLAHASLGPPEAFEREFFGERLALGGVPTANLEGYLFPETYLIPSGATPREIAAQLTGQFRAELPPDAAALARHLHLTVAQVVTVASLVEREAKADDERALMAGVYYNRLRRGMPLQVDATIEYTFGRHKAVITAADLARDSPYNTYEHRGLPPTPIANPGRASLWAAFHPQPSPYLYYVAMGNGRSAFSRTLAEHNANVARYLK
jgi:UPF0755 protein